MILITGATGFIGSSLSDFLLAKRYKVRRTARTSIGKSYFKLDLENSSDIKNSCKNINTIFHLAAQSDIVPSIEKPVDYIETNFNGTLNILNLMNRFKIKKIVYAASSSCYGIPKNYPTDEKEKEAQVTKKTLEIELPHLHLKM